MELLPKSPANGFPYLALDPASDNDCAVLVRYLQDQIDEVCSIPIELLEERMEACKDTATTQITIKERNQFLGYL